MNRLGFWLGAGAQSVTDQRPDVAPPEANPCHGASSRPAGSPSDAAVCPGRAVSEAGVHDTVAVPEPSTPSDCPLAGTSQTEGLEPTGPTLVPRHCARPAAEGDQRSLRRIKWARGPISRRIRQTSG
jgi:hypothetical protein